MELLGRIYVAWEPYRVSNRHLWEAKFAAEWPPNDWKDLTVMVAISGGGDSVALARGLLATHQRGEGRVVAAHFNHGLRGEESDEDARFVKEFCRHHRISLRMGHFSGKADAEGVSEERARNARYAFLRHAAEVFGARYVATGHTRDDQVETILHRLFRGTGIRGLSGIPRVRRLGPATVLIRPMLNFGREEIRAYLEALEQPFREDSSNVDGRFTRNRIRQELLPYLRGHLNEHVDEAVLRLSTLAGETQEFVESMVRPVLDRAITESNESGVTLNRGALVGESPFLLRELLVLLWQNRKWPLKSMTYQHWQAIATMIGTEEASASKRVFPGSVVVEVRARTLRMTRECDA